MHQVARSLLTALILTAALQAQVTTATLYGEVHDASGAAASNSHVTITNQGTSISREATADTRGEFTVTGLPVGRYTVRVELQGFKTFVNDGLELNAGQVVRQVYSLEVGSISDNVTVTETAPLLETASAAQKESLSTREVRSLPLARRNVTSLLTLSTGVTEASTGLAGGGNIRLNGVSEGGTAITVDGTDATANNETRGLNSYGAQNQISVMSIEAVAEVQVIKGIMPAEYGGATGGQVNMITRSGTNAFHGSLFESLQNDKLFAKYPFFAPGTPKPAVRFNQFGGSLGGRIIPNRAFFFAAYEGYRESFGLNVDGVVPTQQLRSQILAALPGSATQAVLDSMPLPNSPIDANIGRYRTAKARTRSDDTLLVKGDVLLGGGNLSVTFSRMRPDTVNPAYFNGNDQRFNSKQDRIATQYVLARGSWASETRFGWNRNSLDRLNDSWMISPGGASDDLVEVGKRLPQMTVTGLFATPIAEILAMRGRSYTFEQKFSRIMASHNTKIGFRFGRQAGSKTNPNTPNFTFQNLTDLFANVPNQMNIQNGQPAHDAHLNDFGFFIQDDWKVSSRLVINMGLRADFYPSFQVKPTTDRPAEIVNLESPTDLAKMDFGAPRPADKIYNPDWNNFGPRFGITWDVDGKGSTVIRAGTGVLFSPLVFALIQNNVSDPEIGAATNLNRTDLAARNLKWGNYGDQIQDSVRASNAGKKGIFSLIDPNLRNPYTIQTMVNVQHSFGRSWMFETGYIRTDGNKFPLSRPLAQAFDRVTGVRPNPALGTPSGVYLTSEQTMVYNAWQTSIRRRFESSLGMGFHYTYSRGWAEQGGSLASVFVNSEAALTQDFFNPFYDRAPLSQEARSRIAADVVYQLPFFNSARNWKSHAFGGWQISGILSARTGVPLRVTQPSGITNSRPDLTGSKPVLDNYRDTLLYLDRSQFTLVPTSGASGPTLRPGNANPSLIRGPGAWNVNMSLSKGFRFTESVRLDLRVDAFNAFNHVNYNNPTLAINSPQFGVITGSADQRTAQVGARLAF
jgi:hypothetical protein